MAKIDGIFNNFANHVTSGLSCFITAAYDACERARTTTLLLRLLPVIELPQSFARDESFGSSAHALRDKFAEILGAESQMSLDQIASLVVETDFIPDEALVQERRREMAAVHVDYGHDPIYRCTVSMRLVSGRDLTLTTRDQYSALAEARGGRRREKRMPPPEYLKYKELVSRYIDREGLTSCMNDAKWRAAIAAVESVAGYHPRFRVRCLMDQHEPTKHWDGSWPWHVPWPVSIEWLELDPGVQTVGVFVPVVGKDFTQQLSQALLQAHIPFSIEGRALRIWGYIRPGASPKFVRSSA